MTQKKTYVEGDRQTVCRCGSGKKYKKCCALREHEEIRLARLKQAEEYRAWAEEERKNPQRTSPGRRSSFAAVTALLAMGGALPPRGGR
jgi:hypothetical protein